MANPCHARSISLPSRSHPATLKIQEELSKLKALEASSSSLLGAMCSRLFGMEDSYKCLDELLSLSSTQQALSHLRNEKWFNELLDGPVKLLDICETARDVISQFKENVGDLGSALRRKIGDVGSESCINNYVCSRKKMKNEAKKLLAAIKKMDSKTVASLLLDQDHQLPIVIRVLREVNAMSISIFQSLVLFLSSPVLKSKRRKRSLVANYMHKRLVSCEEEHAKLKELEDIDFALQAVSSERADFETLLIAQKGLGALEVSVEGLDSGFECMFRHQIKTRTSLLNVISHECQQPSLPSNPAQVSEF